MKTRIKTTLALIVVLSLAFFTACNQEKTSTDTKETTTVRFLLTDAPFPFEWVEEANVTIDRLEIRQATSHKRRGRRK